MRDPPEPPCWGPPDVTIFRSFLLSYSHSPKTLPLSCLKREVPAGGVLGATDSAHCIPLC